ncbi:MAG: flagellar basal body P-ring protein FlgI [Candidatus Riflebacteria bacterium]|nr:flagellar basal body P-ring protein FlgI [Candidatus Riflebacteria bacterium]
MTRSHPAPTRRPLPALTLTLGLAVVLALATPSVVRGQAQVRLKDIARVAGSREYQIIGYGLVTGLDGTGDKTPMSLEMVRGMLQNMGMELGKDAVQSKNCAAVVVTAMIPPYGKAGETFDVVISSIGDSKSLQGGVLLPTLLKGGDGQVYAVAQGNVSIGGIQAGTGAAGAAGAGGAAAQKNHLTVARIPHGAIQEREVGDSFGQDGRFNLVLQRKDAALSRRVKEAIERKFGDGWVRLANPGTVEVRIPSSFKDDPVSFAAAIEDLPLSIEEPNRVVINERTGTIIVGNRVRIGRVVISQGGLRIEVGGSAAAARTGAGAQGKEAPRGSLIAIKGETTVDDLVGALNAVGATPKDIIAIFQAIDTAGALHGELKIM